MKVLQGLRAEEATVLEKLKVLSGALALNEFTIAELTRYAGVKEQTVRTVLNREQGVFEELRREKTGRRGGSTGVHRLRPEHVAALENDIGKIYNDLPLKKRVEDPAPALVTLDLAEEFLTRHFGETSDIEKREEIIKLATKQIEAVRGNIEKSATDVLPPDMIEKINQRLAMLDAARNTCVELIDHQRRMADIRKEMEEMRKKLEDAELAVESPPAISVKPQQRVYASPRAAAFVDALRDCDVVLVGAAAGAVADSVRDISEHEHAHFVGLPLDPDKASDSDIDLVMKRLKLIRSTKSGYRRGLFELVYAVDTSRHSRPLLLSILNRMARAILPMGATDPVVLDTSYDATFRNDVFRMQGHYAGNADQLDSGAMLEVVRKPLLKPVLTALVASNRDSSPLVRG
jgi:hypothetical protein